MNTNRVDKILVTSGVEATDVATMVAGDYVVLVDGEAANTPIENSYTFRVAVKSLDGSVKYSNSLKGSDIVSAKVEPFAPIVEQVATLTLTQPVAGTEYTVTLVDRSDKEILQRRQDKRSYQVIASDGETADTLAAKIVVAINSDQDTFVVATSAGAVVTLTAKAKSTVANAVGQFGLQHYFEVGSHIANTRGQYEPYGTVDYVTDPDFGSGSFSDVRTIEQDSAGYDGFLNRTQFPVIQPNYDSVAGTDYDYLVLEIDNNYWSNSVVAGKVDSPLTLVLAVTSGATASLETIFDNYITA